MCCVLASWGPTPTSSSLARKRRYWRRCKICWHLEREKHHCRAPSRQNTRTMECLNDDTRDGTNNPPLVSSLSSGCPLYFSHVMKNFYDITEKKSCDDTTEKGEFLMEKQDGSKNMQISFSEGNKELSDQE